MEANIFVIYVKP